MEKRRVAVRTMVETVMLSGSLSRDASAKRMLDGIRGHRALQSIEEAGAQNEVPVSLAITQHDVELTVYGRIDRLYGTDVVEEIKTTLVPVKNESETNPQHWAQAMCYAYMLCKTNAFPGILVRLTYYNLNGGHVTSFDRALSLEALETSFLALVEQYLLLVRAEMLHQTALTQDVKQAGFPFAAYRAGQRTFAEQTYTAIRQKAALLCQAPTGTGKTMAALFPALKAVGEGLISRVFYLTARTTQQNAAADAVRLLNMPNLISVVLSAKEKICPFDPPCDMDACPLAEGYYNRLPDALHEAGEMRGLFVPERVKALSRRFHVCPFELSLDLSEIADLIVCDYNYAFDPRVRLQRFFLRGRLRQVLLVDEAHNLPDRARGMYSATLNMDAIMDARRTVPKNKRRGALYRQMTLLLAEMAALFPDDGAPRAEEAPPASLLPVVTAVAALLADAEPAIDMVKGRALLFELTGFLFIFDQYSECYRTLYQGAKTKRTVTLFCTDPSKSLAAAYKKCTGAVFFSATLEPFPFYRALLGLPGDAPVLSLASPFPRENFIVLHRAISVRYRARQETLLAVTEAAARFVLSRGKGNFMVFLPSYAYLAQFEAAFSDRVCPEVAVQVQTRDMDDAARQAFLERFIDDPQGTTVGLAVLGGAFGEGIDLPEDRLSGAVVIGVGMPQLCVERDTLKAAYDDLYDAGFDYAYRFPGVSKVLQAAGRVIRTERDRGALLLIDDRYARQETRMLLPAHWDVHPIFNDAQMESLLRAFWQAPRP